jgi:drug/metabolite transporter (DMT)-like permease
MCIRDRLWTVGLAYLFAGESMNRWKAAGFALGFSGVLVLMGPEAIGGAATANLIAEAGLLVATLCYAVSVVLSRRAPPIRPRVFACATALTGAALASPAIALAEIDPSKWSVASALSVIALGIGPTGLAGLIIIILVRRVGAGFMSLANYLTPVWAVGLGAALFNERLEPTVLIALGLILAGVATSRRAA